MKRVRPILLGLVLLSCSCSTRPPLPRPPESGEKIFHSRCITCHGIEGSGQRRGSAFAGDFTDPKGILAGDDKELARVIREGKEGNLGRMPAFGPILNEEEIQNVIDYIRSRFGSPSKPDLE